MVGSDDESRFYERTKIYLVRTGGVLNYVQAEEIIFTKGPECMSTGRYDGMKITQGWAA